MIRLSDLSGFLRALRDEVQRDRVLAVAAGVTFYALLAVVPAITALISIFGLILAVMIVVLAVVYRWAPNRPDAEWRWITPGAVVASVGLVLISGGLGWYVANFGSYDETYGSLAAVVVLMLWLWLSTVMVLVGAELNAELDRRTAARR